MPLPWDQIHELEVGEDYPAAIDALEDRLQQHHLEREAVLRLGFNLWYAIHEEARMCKGLPTERYASRFMELFREHRSQMEGDADFCWAFGLGLSLFWFEFPGADDQLGEALLARARELDSSYARMDQEEMSTRFRGRGIFASYYAIAEQTRPSEPGDGALIDNRGSVAPGRWDVDTSMRSPRTWFQQKLGEPCGCRSGKSYRSCCLRRESAYFVIGALAAVLLFGAHDEGLVAVLVILGAAAVAGWIASRYFGRT